MGGYIDRRQLPHARPFCLPIFLVVHCLTPALALSLSVPLCCSANQLADLFEEYDGTADRKRRRAARAAAQVSGQRH
jgi:hypothetical protein